MNSIAELYRLQEIDTAGDKLRRRILQLQKVTGGSATLKEARERAQAMETEITDTRKAQREAEMEAEALSGRIKDSETMLMSGEVRNPKELEALQSNVDAMRRHKSALDDRSVEAMVKADELSQKFDQFNETLERQESEWETKRLGYEEELLRRKKEYLYVKNLREQAVKTIGADFLEQYEYLRGRKNGIAVAQLEDDSCGACHMQLPSGVVSHVRRGGEMVNCTACGRILYVAE